MPLTVLEEILYGTHRIECLSNGQVTGTGTGFLYMVELAQGRELIVLITNKHVTDGCDALRLLAHLKGGDGLPSGATQAITIPAHGNIFPHPNPDVDIAAVTMGAFINKAERDGKPLFIKAATAAIIPAPHDWNKFDAVEDVMMFGCPKGIFDMASGRPIARRGVTATPCYERYCGRNEFLVDMACFPGSSGSPVYLMSYDGFDRSQNLRLQNQPRLFLLGILHAGPSFDADGRITMGELPTVKVATMLHLGQVIQSTELVALGADLRSRTGFN